MTDIRNRLEGWFERLAHTIYRHPIKTIIIMLVFIAILVSQLPRITFDLSTEGFLHQNDPYLLEYNDFRDQFGRDEVVILAIEPANVFDTDFFHTLKQLHEEIEEHVPYLEEVTSMINARNTRGDADVLIVEDLLETLPSDEQDMQELRARVLGNAMYKNLLISEDGRITTIVIRTQNYSSRGKEEDALEGFGESENDLPQMPGDASTETAFLTNEENSEVVFAVQKIIKKYRSSDLKIYLAGSPAVTHTLKTSMVRDMRKFVVLAVIAIALLLFIMFRRMSGIVLPLLIVVFSLLSTLGLMAIFKTPIKLPTQILPSFLLAVSIGASVHILAIFYHDFQNGGNKEDAIAYALGHSGLACVMTHITTAMGLLSFSVSKIAPIADIGIYAGFGIMVALIYTIVLIPAFLAVMPIKIKPSQGNTKRANTMSRLLIWISNFSTQNAIAILVVTGCIILIAIPMILKINFGHDPLRWFPADDSVRMATEKIDHGMRGSVNLEVIIDTGKENGLYDPVILKKLDMTTKYVEGLDYGDVFAGKAWCLTTILKEIHQALNENQAAYYVIPQNRDIVAQEFLLFENSGADDLEDVVDSQFSMARFTVKAPFLDALKYKQLMAEIVQNFEGQFPQMTIKVTGMIPLLFRTVSNVMISMARSYIIAIVVITVLMVFLIGRVRIGLLSMLPNITPIVIMLGIMGMFSFPMDVFSMMVGSIAIGLAVDDTIHFMHNFRRYYEQKGDPVWAVHETLQTTGRAMLVTTVVLSIGFFIFMLAGMRNLFNFGFLTGITIIMALLADYFLAPALMVIANKSKSQ